LDSEVSRRIKEVDSGVSRRIEELIAQFRITKGEVRLHPGSAGGPISTISGHCNTVEIGNGGKTPIVIKDSGSEDLPLKGIYSELSHKEVTANSRIREFTANSRIRNLQRTLA
jgi:hypothetical protein